MHNRSLRIEEVENGFTVTISLPKNVGKDVYPDYENLEFIAKSSEDVADLVGQFLNKQDMQQKDKPEILVKPAVGTLLSE